MKPKRIDARLSDSGRQILTRARDEARRLRHEYVGTEHLLLGLVHDGRLERGPTVVADILTAFGATAAAVRARIERLVTCGSQAPAAGELPFTPRARQAIDFACDEARSVGQERVEAEHLLLGLLREPDGVAGRVLRDLGLNLDVVRGEALKIRVLQMTLVERAVRPLRATTARKRKMREELLAHLTTIFDEELAASHDPAAAVREAERRFGDPATLAGELEAALPWSERISYFAERLYTWRAPETAARYAWRGAKSTFVVVAVTFFAAIAVAAAQTGWNRGLTDLARTFGAAAVIGPLGQFAIILLYIKLRDALWGAFGSRRSRGRVAALMAATSLCVLGLAAGFTTIAHADFGAALALWPSYLSAAILAPVAALFAARQSGPAEIRDAHWALLDLTRPVGGF